MVRRAHEREERPLSELGVILSDDGVDSMTCGVARSWSS